MDRLIVKNFGPLKDVDIELNKINLFIGENGSGKSVLGKIITIILNFDTGIEIDILKKFDDYQINFISNESIIEFNSNNEKIFELRNKKIILDKSIHVLNEVQKAIENIRSLLPEKVKKDDKFFKEILKVFKENGKIEKDKIESLEKYLISLAKLTTQYIPAERNLISIFNKYVTTFITADIPLPKFLLNFSSQYVRAREEIRALDFLNVKYKFQNDQERIFYNDKDFLLLERSSSGIQSALPLYLTVKYFAQKHRGIIIEEAEQNLFPKAQKETVEYIVEQISDENNLFMMTHSPYVLSTLNILMMAYKAGNINEVSKEKVAELFNEKQWINPNDFSAYYLEDGITRDIKGRTGLISENEIDEISDNIQEDFEELLDIYREHKNDK